MNRIARARARRREPERTEADYTSYGQHTRAGAPYQPMADRKVAKGILVAIGGAKKEHRTI